MDWTHFASLPEASQVIDCDILFSHQKLTSTYCTHNYANFFSIRIRVNSEIPFAACQRSHWKLVELQLCFLFVLHRLIQ